ncbi:hypothetical protein [Halopenitus sp. POP-27]|uniref:hypothetical protein n=1 Tax=Halopenitus sp. POP-27 TaxID=2994425 RepID=UPI002468C2FF|nr:hypothetical protein [Halopenitus sp. POP-27]
MADLDLVDDYSVLVLEESYTLRGLFESWLEGIEVRTVADPDDVAAAFDATVAVACLSVTALDDSGEEVRTQLLTRNPYCQLVGVVSRSTSPDEHEADYDECLQRPVMKAELQEAVDRRLAYGMYSSALRKFYDLNAAFVWRRRDVPDEPTGADGDSGSGTAARSADDDAGDDGTATDAVEQPGWLHRPDARDGTDSDPLDEGRLEDVDLEEPIGDLDPDEIVERYRRVCRQLDVLQERLSGAAIAEISMSIRRHKDYLTTPSADVDRGPPAKHHPRRCPACKLPWGVDHGNELGTGFTRIAAGVRRCTRCREIVHGLGESGRRITGR